MGNHLTTSSISLSADLLKQSGRIVASFVPATLKILMELPHMTFPSNRRFALGKLTGSQPAPNGLTLNPQLNADGALCIAQLMQFDDALITLAPAVTPLLFLSFRHVGAEFQHNQPVATPREDAVRCFVLPAPDRRRPTNS